MNLPEHIFTTIRTFEDNQLPFHALVSELDAAIDGLPDAYPQKKALRAEWWTLEQVNAVLLDRNVFTLSSDQEPLVRGAIARIKQTLSGTKLQG